MRVPFNPVGLVTWVVLYVVCAALPGSLWLLLPAEILAEPVPLRGGQTTTVRQVLGWFPLMMLGAAAVTLATGVVCGALNGATYALARVLAHRAATAPESAAPLVRIGGLVGGAYSCLRVALMLTGITFMLVGIFLIWSNIANGDLVAGITNILIAIGGGAGLATGAAHYRN